jgi:hypothetical protein
VHSALGQGSRAERIAGVFIEMGHRCAGIHLGRAGAAFGIFGCERAACFARREDQAARACRGVGAVREVLMRDVRERFFGRVRYGSVLPP